MQLPNGEHARIELKKLEDYCLNFQHPPGHHKARVFPAALGWKREQAEQLRSALLDAAANEKAILGTEDEFGQRYTIDFAIGNANVRSVWILPADEEVPHLVTCFVK